MRIAGRVFEDTMDGYFPLSESLRQLLARHQFCTAWLSILHAPIIDVPGLPDNAPIPLYVTSGRSGMIHRLQGLVRYAGDLVEVDAEADWAWSSGASEDPLLAKHRLAEPVFVRGIGLIAGDVATPFGSLRSNPGSQIAIAQPGLLKPDGWRVWQCPAPGSGIVAGIAEDEQIALFTHPDIAPAKIVAALEREKA